MNRKIIENIFQCSNSSDELFDAFQAALSKNICEVDSYKILLANPCLNNDELKLFSETLSKVFKEKAHDIFLWTGSVFEAKACQPHEIENPINYYMKAWNVDKTNADSLLNLINLYNYDLDLPYNNLIVNFVKERVLQTTDPGRVYLALSNLYENLGDIEMKHYYMSLAQKS